MSDVRSAPDEAREAIATLVDHFRSVWSEARVHLFRQHLQVTITSATPLLGRMSTAGALNIESSMWSLRPPPLWPGLSPSAPRPIDVDNPSSPECFRVRHRPSEHLVEARSIGHPDGGILIRVTRRSVEISCEIDGHPLRTLEGRLYLRLPDDLPEVMAAAAIGRPLHHLVAHPWLDASEWTILRMRPSGRGTWVVVSTGSDSFEMPWYRLLPAPFGLTP